MRRTVVQLAKAAKREPVVLPKTSEWVKDAVKPYVKISSEDVLPERLEGSSLSELFKSKFSVTDLATQYCELRTFYYLIGSVERQETRAMLRGTDIHDRLQKTVNKQYAVPDTVVVTLEDEWAKKLLEVNSRLAQLRETGTAREVYVMGFINDRLVTGYIDSLVRHNDGKIMVVDSKSRSSDTLPSFSQQLSAYHQVLFYRLLLDNLRNLDVAKLAQSRDLDLDAAVNTELVSVYSDQPNITLRMLFEELKNHADALELLDNVQVEYVRTRGRGKEKRVETIGIITYHYDQPTVDQLIDFSFAFWDNKRDPVGVEPDDIVKCKYCEFAPKCYWRAELERDSLL